MKFHHAVRVRPALAALAAAVALGDRTARVDRRAAQFGARYQLRVDAAHKLLGT